MGLTRKKGLQILWDRKHFFIPMEKLKGKFVPNWLEIYFDSKMSKLDIRLELPKGDVDKKKIKTFWSKTLGVPLKNIRDSIENKHGGEKGICTIKMGNKKVFLEITKGSN